MKLPKRVMVLTQSYKVVVSKTLLKDHGACGMCDIDNHTIYLDASLKKHPRLLKRVFYHEQAHAFAEESGVSQFMHDQSAEMFAQNLSAFLIQLKP